MGQELVEIVVHRQLHVLLYANEFMGLGHFYNHGITIRVYVDARSINSTSVIQACMID